MSVIVKRGGLLAAAALVSALLGSRVGAAPPGQAYLDQSRPTADRVEDLLRQMTLAEKVGQMDQILVGHVTTPATSRGCPGCFGDPDPAAMRSVLIDNQVGSLLAGGTDMPFDTSHSGGVGNTGRDWAVTYNGIQAFAVQQSRLHIPVLFGVDAGARLQPSVRCAAVPAFDRHGCDVGHGHG